MRMRGRAARQVDLPSRSRPPRSSPGSLLGTHRSLTPPSRLGPPRPAVCRVRALPPPPERGGVEGPLSGAVPWPRLGLRGRLAAPRPCAGWGKREGCGGGAGVSWELAALGERACPRLPRGPVGRWPVPGPQRRGGVGCRSSCPCRSHED